eukprot:TRINITY_DN2958_c0_g1_i2.p1 TRINITY_DN2958_c0_g1~~TRINITY_DN2958_c0_g1_i2.p1  ORF type:complete len:440 (-),score=111.79 TRINITY_DN2958_c0_g1_i2:576-1850(-)
MDAVVGVIFGLSSSFAFAVYLLTHSYELQPTIDVTGTEESNERVIPSLFDPILDMASEMWTLTVLFACLLAFLIALIYISANTEGSQKVQKSKVDQKSRRKSITIQWYGFPEKTSTIHTEKEAMSVGEALERVCLLLGLKQITEFMEIREVFGKSNETILEPSTDIIAASLNFSTPPRFTLRLKKDASSLIECVYDCIMERNLAADLKSGLPTAESPELVPIFWDSVHSLSIILHPSWDVSRAIETIGRSFHLEPFQNDLVIKEIIFGKEKTLKPTDQLVQLQKKWPFLDPAACRFVLAIQPTSSRLDEYRSKLETLGTAQSDVEQSQAKSKLKRLGNLPSYRILSEFSRSYHIVCGMVIAWMAGNGSWSLLWLPMSIILMYQVDIRQVKKTLRNHVQAIHKKIEKIHFEISHGGSHVGQRIFG